MRYLNELAAEDRVDGETYLVKKFNVYQTKNGKDYWSLTVSDKTMDMDAKIWSPSDSSIDDFHELDYIKVKAEIQDYKGQLQMIIRSAKKMDAANVNQGDFLPTSEKDQDEMFKKLLKLIDSVQAPYMRKLLDKVFIEDSDFKKDFRTRSAAKSVHHGFVGGLLEHTLSVTEICDFFAKHYDFIDRDLLITAALCHDIGKTKELTTFPANEYTDEGQLLGHIVIGAKMVWDICDTIPDFPETKKNELIHCILAHHGKLEFGSPKTPELVEAFALSFADNMDAKMETFKEAIEKPTNDPYKWLGVNRFLETNIRRTTPESDE